jgi:hypothetical protein
MQALDATFGNPALLEVMDKNGFNICPDAFSLFVSINTNRSRRIVGVRRMGRLAESGMII